MPAAKVAAGTWRSITQELLAARSFGLIDGFLIKGLFPQSCARAATSPSSVSVSTRSSLADPPASLDRSGGFSFRKTRPAINNTINITYCFPTT